MVGMNTQRHEAMGVLTPLAALAAGVILVFLAATGCSPSKYAVNHVMVPMLGNARDAAFESNDILTFRDAAPANLFLLEGMIRTDPEVVELRLNAAMLYFSYAFAFIEESDTEYASLLYRRGFTHAFAALIQKNKKLAADLFEISYDEFETLLPELRAEDVPAAVWAAINRAQYISLHLDSTEVLRDVPKVTALLERITELDPSFFEGMPYVTLGSLHAFKPPIMGGDPEAANASFQQAFTIAGNSFLLSRYFYARFYSYRIQDVELFTQTLNEVITAELPATDPYQLLNLIAKEKSTSLLEEADELF
jgi:hypothetical protein